MGREGWVFYFIKFRSNWGCYLIRSLVCTLLRKRCEKRWPEKSGCVLINILVHVLARFASTSISVIRVYLVPM